MKSGKYIHTSRQYQSLSHLSAAIQTPLVSFFCGGYILTTKSPTHKRKDVENKKVNNRRSAQLRHTICHCPDYPLCSLWLYLNFLTIPFVCPLYTIIYFQNLFFLAFHAVFCKLIDSVNEYKICCKLSFHFWHFRNFPVLRSEKNSLKNFRLTFVKIALCDVVGSERKMRVWETSQQAKCDAFYGKGYSFPMLAEKLLTS